MRMTASQMYEILRHTINTIGDSIYGDCFILKGGSALMSMLVEEGKTEYFRATKDIDLHVFEISDWKSFKSNILHILNNNNHGIVYDFIESRPKCTETSDGVVLISHSQIGDMKFGIDMNVKAANIITISYLSSLSLRTYDKHTMLSDKIAAISSKTIFRRVKDVYDICVLSQLDCYASDDILDALLRKNPSFFESGCNMLVYENMESLAHAYNKFYGIEQKPEFENVVGLCTKFLVPIYRKERGLLWDGECWRVIKH